jgi:hypothetical protein
MLSSMGKRITWVAGSAAATAATLCLQNLFDLNVRPDFLSFELEYWSNRYPNSYERVYEAFVPIPEWENQTDTTKLNILDHNRWRWSVHTRKQIGDFYVKLQIAHDHTIVYTPMLHKFSPVDNLGAPGSWWWTFKTGYSF